MKGLITPFVPRPSARSGPPMILIIDDSRDTRELLSLHMRNAGYRVTVAEDAVAAGHRVAEAAPDLIICDCKMPFMDGVDFIAALRGDATIPDIPVVFIASREHKTELAGRTFGFPLLSKPLVADDLLATVAGQLRRYAAAS
jgi:two-component system, OmpR family, phosphate regulon response regulator PhoB